MQGPLKYADLAEKTDGLGFKLLLRGVQSRAKESVCHPEVSLEELEKPLYPEPGPGGGPPGLPLGSPSCCTSQ